MLLPDKQQSIGIGVDVEGIDRFRQQKILENATFLNKIFTEQELTYCFSFHDPAPRLAAHYCGKEAMVKALSSCLGLNIDYKAIEIYHDERGVPKVDLPALSCNVNASLSLSHSQNNAVAFAVVVEVNNNGIS